MNKIALTAVLGPLVGQAADLFASFDQMAELGAWLPINHTGLSVLTDEVSVMLAVEPVFLDHPQRRVLSPCGSMLATPDWIAGSLLQQAVKRGPASAVDWLEKVMGTERATGRFVAHVSGVTVAEPMMVSDELTLLPFEQLPDTNAKRTIVRSSKMAPGRVHIGHQPQLETAAYFRVPEFPFLVDNVAALADPFAAAADQHFEEQIIALTAIEGCRPAIELRWFEFDDPDLAAVEAGTAFTWRMREGMSAFQGTMIGPEAAKIMEERRSLDERSLAIIDLALGRLNLAMRRLSSGDKAIDASICLEALLCSASEDSSFTSVLKNRAAELLGGTYLEQRSISKAVAALYILRGKTVHGRLSRGGRKPTPEDVVATGLPVCARLIRALLQRGSIPEWPSAK